MAERKRVRGRKRTKGSPWTQDEVRTLCSSWGTFSARALKQRLALHSWTAIRQKARALGLPSRPQGFIAISSLAKRCGVEYPTMVRVLEWGHITIFFSYPAPKPGALRSRAVKWQFVDEVEALECFERWLRAERTSEAAKRLGQPHMRLWYRAQRAGLLTPRRALRLAPEVWDQLAAQPLWSRAEAK